MTYRLDTHTFLWWVGDPGRLSPAARDVCDDPAQTLLLSVAGVWEVVIKLDTGERTLDYSVPQVVAEYEARGDAVVPPVWVGHALRVAHLPSIHRDPFDRVPVAQAQAESGTALTADRLVRQYPVPTPW